MAWLALQVMVFAVLLQLVWVVVTIVLSVAVLYLLLIHRLIESGASCINLNHFGEPIHNFND